LGIVVSRISSDATTTVLSSDLALASFLKG
jgi:hypothetical protein